MENSDRMQRYFERSRKIAMDPPKDTFLYDASYMATQVYADCPRWEKISRSYAYAIVNQKIYIDEEDTIIGRVYYNETKPEFIDPDVDGRLTMNEFAKSYRSADPEFNEFAELNIVTHGSPAHISWDWNYILKHGTEGIKARCRRMMARKANDSYAQEFYNAVIILVEALEEWSDKHIAELEKMGKTEEAEILRRVPRYPARSFREAVQAFFMQFIIVMKENPYGGNSPGRLDYYLWPYLEEDLRTGKCTLEEAERICEELFIRIDERLYGRDGWGETIALAGTHPNGESALNPLSYTMIRAYMKYNTTHPLLYARIGSKTAKDFIDLCAEYVMKGQNRAQLLNDDAIIRALIKNGVSEQDAYNYYCGGCMEVGIQGKTSDLLFSGYHNILKILELCITGGYCLHRKKQYQYIGVKPLTEYSSFEEFYTAFIEKTRYILKRSLNYLDALSERLEVGRPAYLLSSMIENCIDTGRNMHGGGAKYHDYGAAFVGIPNTADSLTAIKKAVFTDKICTAEELLDAIRANFEGYEALRAKLIAIPKFGQENDEADKMAIRLSTDLCEVYSSYVNRFGGNGKTILLSFVYSANEGARTGASPDGRLAGVALAQSITPQSMAMTKGITVAMNSCTKLPFDLFSGAASTMWDLDHTWASAELVSALVVSFFEQGGHIFQGNVTDVEELIRAQESPDDYRHLIVRVGGYSARFVTLNRELQNDIINRIRHSC